MFDAILSDHFRRYPALQLQDLYKLIHQAALGSGHAVPDPAAARARLQRELAELGTGPDEPMIDPISPDIGIVRVHLRPFLAAGGDPGSLVDAFVRTAHVYRGHADRLEAYWTWAIALAARGGLPFFPADMAGFLASLKSDPYPAVHHSPEFESSYRPAYRVVMKSFLP